MGINTCGFIQTENKGNMLDVVAVIVDGLYTSGYATQSKFSLTPPTVVVHPCIHGHHSAMITFMDPHDINEKTMLPKQRSLFICYTTDSNTDTKGDLIGPGFYMSLGAWGNSVDIMKVALYSAKSFGATFIDEDDCDSSGEYTLFEC